MAKSSIRKTDSPETTAPKRRRTTAAAETTGVTKPAVKAAPRRRKAVDATTVEAVVASPVDVDAAEIETVDVSHEQIAVRAYHIYLERGYPGDQFQDWLTAERQLREQYSRAR